METPLSTQEMEPHRTASPADNLVLFQGAGRFRGFTGNGLKLFAMAIMLIDHIGAAIILCYYYQTFSADWRTVYMTMRIIGRVAFPIFAFMIAMGARFTHDIRKYLLRLGIFALLSEIPFDLAFDFAEPGKFVEFTHQNVYFTLFLGLLALCCLQVFQRKWRFGIVPGVIVLLLLMAAALLLRTDYDATGVLCIFLFYIGADKQPEVRIPTFLAALVAPAVSFSLELAPFSWDVHLNQLELYAMAALLPILLYNGNKGIKMNRFIYYVFYPGHLLLLYFIKIFVLKL